MRSCSKAVHPIKPSTYFTEDPGKILKKMEAVGAEGSIAKLKTSSYEAGHRSGAWVKIKFHKGQEFVIVGYTLPKKSRKYFGALSLGYYKNKRLIFAGRVGTGFNDKALKEIFFKLKPLEIPEAHGGGNSRAFASLATSRMESLGQSLGKAQAGGSGPIYGVDLGRHPPPSLIPRIARGQESQRCRPGVTDE